MRVLRIELYEDKAGEWRWRAVDGSNGNIVADGSEGYKNEGDCEGEARRLFTEPNEVHVVKVEAPPPPDA